MPGAASDRRLTWDPAYPAPYESIWSILLRVVVLNNLTWPELRSLIRQEHLKGYCGESVSPAIATAWIDFGRLAQLLGVDERRLSCGTWQGMGMRPLFQHRYGLRRCPECWECGFHCVLFDLIAISTCPWHRCPLTKACVMCTSTRTFELRSHPNPWVRSDRYCTGCQLRLPNREDYHSMPRIGPDVASMIADHCSELVKWWRDVGVNFPDRDLLLSDLFWVGDAEKAGPYRGWEHSAAATSVPNKALRWEFDLPLEPVRHSAIHVRWPAQDTDDERSIDREYRIRDDAGRCYRSLRKHLYKTYVRRHAKCHRELGQLTREQSLALDGDNVCIVSLAFLIWRMSIESVLVVQGLNVRRNTNFELRLMGPQHTYNLALGDRLRWSYFSFFGIWRRLMHLSTRSKIRVSFHSTRSDGNFHWKAEELLAGLAGTRDRITPLRFAILYPDMDGVSEVELDRCKERSKGGPGPTDEERMWTHAEWAWTNRELDLRNCAFEIRLPERRVPKGFWYISI